MQDVYLLTFPTRTPGECEMFATLRWNNWMVILHLKLMSPTKDTFKRNQIKSFT